MSDRVQPKQRGDEPIQGRRRRVYPYYFSPLFPISIAGTADKGGGSVKTETIHGRRIRPYPTHFSPVLVPAETVPFDPATDGFPYQQGPPPAPAARLVQANFGTFVAEQDVFFDPKDLPTFYQAPPVFARRWFDYGFNPASRGFALENPASPALNLSYRGIFPDLLPRKDPLTPVRGLAATILDIDSILFPHLAWRPAAPDVVVRAVRNPLFGGTPYTVEPSPLPVPGNVWAPQAPHVVFQRSKRQHEYPALFFDPRPLTIPLLSWQAVYPNQVYGKRPLPIRAGERHRILIESFFTGDDASWHPTYPDFARVGEAVPLYWVAPVYETVDIAPEPEAKKRVGGLLTLGAGS